MKENKKYVEEVCSIENLLLEVKEIKKDIKGGNLSELLHSSFDSDSFSSNG